MKKTFIQFGLRTHIYICDLSLNPDPLYISTPSTNIPQTESNCERLLSPPNLCRCCIIAQSKHLKSMSFLESIHKSYHVVYSSNKLLSASSADCSDDLYDE